MIMLLAALVVASDPAGAAPQPQAPALTVAPTPKKVAPKKICRNLDADTGTHMSKRLCKTEDEWAIYDQGRSIEDLKTTGQAH